MKRTAKTPLLFLLILMAINLAGCSRPTDQIDPDTLPTTEKNTTCPDLDSMLFQLTQSETPLETAEKLGLNLQDEKVQALLMLESENTVLPEQFDLEIGTRSGAQVQAFVPIDQLCDLANTPEVIAIKTPAVPLN